MKPRKHFETKLPGTALSGTLMNTQCMKAVFKSQVSSVSKVTGHWLDGRGLLPGEAGVFTSDTAPSPALVPIYLPV
jgi:hypothetical protein